MNNRIFCGLMVFFIALMMSWPALAKDPNKDEILNGLAGRYQQLTALQASYSRLASTPSADQVFKGGSSQTATGLLSWSKPAKLLLDQKMPQPEIMVTDGASVWWYIPTENLVNLYKNLDVAGQLKPLITFLSGLDSLNANFKVAGAPKDKNRPNQYGLILTPLIPHEGGLDKLIVWCDKDFQLSGFKMTSITGESTDFYLSGLMENPKLDDKIFKFKIPKGADVIENTGNE